MIDGLLLNSLSPSSRGTVNGSILTPTPIKPNKHLHSLVSTIAGLATTPSMIPSTSFPSQSSTTLTTTHHTTGSPTIDWTHERIIRLIQMYEKKTVLWNPSNPEYFHRDIRNMVYEDLVRELNIPDLTVNETKRKLENLRSYFRRETKKLQDHERKTSEKIVSRWPYYECLQFIQEFMSVKNETGSEVGFQKNFGKSAVYQLPTMKRESHIPVVTSNNMECAVQVPIGSTPTIDSVASAFSVANTDLMAVLKALQGPLAETGCFPLNGASTIIDEQMQTASPYHSPDQSTRSPQATNKESDAVRACTPPSSQFDTSQRNDTGESTPKKRRLERESSIDEVADLCSDYGRTVAHQLREMSTYNRDLCRLQIDKLIFDIMHKEQENKTETEQQQASEARTSPGGKV